MNDKTKKVEPSSDCLKRFLMAGMKRTPYLSRSILACMDGLNFTPYERSLVMDQVDRAFRKAIREILEKQEYEKTTEKAVANGTNGHGVNSHLTESEIKI